MKSRANDLRREAAQHRRVREAKQASKSDVRHRSLLSRILGS